MPSPISPAALLSYLGESAEPLLERYFDSGEFTGGSFERFAGGGDRPEVANRFTSDDIVAVSMLSVRIPGRAALRINETQQDELTRLLSEIPTNVELAASPESLVASGSHADQLWHRLVELPGVEWVTASKLMARKRPHLIPVYDRVVKAALNRPDHDDWWIPLRAALIEDPRVVTRLTELRAALSLDDISLLRILDVAIWMQESGEPEPDPDS